MGIVRGTVLLYLCGIKTSKAILDIIIGFGFNNSVVCKKEPDGNQAPFFWGIVWPSGVSRLWPVLPSFDLDDHSPVGCQGRGAIVGYFENEVYGFSGGIVGYRQLAAGGCVAGERYRVLV